MSRIAIIGIGNVLTGDDAVGPTVVRLLEAQWELPPDVQVVDAGTPGLDLTAYLAGLDALLIVDAVKTRKAAPGEVRLYDKRELVERPPVMSISPHEPGVREALLNAEFMGVSPRVVKLVGVVPAQVETGIALSDAVREALPRAVAAVVAELRALGVEPRPRVPPLAPDLWWERKPGA
jgi:hydrogenase maturation protease